MEEEPKLDKTVIKLQKAILRGIEIYLKNHSFGIGSLWVHGATGKKRAETVRKLILESSDLKLMIKILVALLNSHGHKLKYYVSNSVFYGCVWDDLLTLVADREEGEVATYSILKFLKEKHLYCFDPNLNSLLM